VGLAFLITKPLYANTPSLTKVAQVRVEKQEGGALGGGGGGEEVERKEMEGLKEIKSYA
jgi:hypothetical protein